MTHPVTPPHVQHPFRALFVVSGGFLFLFLVLRTIAVEPFGVPTGSMAPALIGHHRDGTCPRCKYTVRVGWPSGSNGDPPTPRAITAHFATVVCPNCDEEFSLANARDLSGDRLLVDKNVYDLRRPRRWEMVVFRCPNPKPSEFGKPYVKRLAGLPGETLTIADGDVYVNGEIARKGLPEVRETMIPVFDMAYAPAGGWGMRWRADPLTDPRLPVAPGPKLRAADAVLKDGALILDASAFPQAVAGATYCHWNLDSRKETPVRAWNAYNGKSRISDKPAAHDFILTCDVEITAVTDGGDARFGCRLTDGADAVAAEVTVGPREHGRAQLAWEKHDGLGVARGVALESGHTYRIEFAFVDRRVFFAIDGRLAVPPGDLPAPVARGEVMRPLRLTARGCRVAVRNLKLFRDIYYTSDDSHGPGGHGTRHPAKLGTGEYFVLGDNSGNSEDSRKWPEPAVPEANFIGKPFLIHQPLRLSHVRVGGREREIQTLDWSRLRWLH